MSIILCMSFCIVLFAYFLSMLITAMLLSRSCPTVDLKKYNVLMRRRTLKDLSAEHKVAGIVASRGWRQHYIGQAKCYGDHFGAWSLPPRLRFFQLTSHLIAFHYPRHKNLIQLGCCCGLDNSSIRFLPMRTKLRGHCPQTLITAIP